MAVNLLQYGDPYGTSDNPLGRAPAPPYDPATATLPDTGTPTVVDPLVDWLASMRAKHQRDQPSIWPMSNPVGTQSLGEQSLSMPRGPYDQVAFMRQDGSPVMASDIAAAHQAIETAKDVAPTMALGMMGTTGARYRRIGPGYETIDPSVPAPPGEPPVFGIGHNNPPVRSAIWAAPQTRGGVATSMAGRMGSNADATLEALGLPAYNDIVPSTNTGPVPESLVQSGSPVRPGQVFDLSDTWRVPDVPQEPLSRIDPEAGRRKGLPPHIIDATTDPEIRAKLRTVAEAGLKTGGAYWYNAEPLRLAFVTELGPEEGNATFAKYMRTVGAVSAGSDVSQNIRTASYYNVRERQGNPVQGEQLPNKKWTPIDLESPYGHKMQGAQYGAYRDIAGGNPLDPEMRPKRASFDANLSGNQEPVTVDKHNLRLIGMLSKDPEFLNTTQTADVNYPSIGVKKGDKINWRDEVKSGRLTIDQMLEIPQAWKDVPEANHYAALEGFQQDLAREMGISPAQLQAALWVGGGRVTGLRSLPTSFMGAVEGRLQKTAATLGGTPTKALLDFVRGKKPLLSPLAATVGAGAAANALQPDDTRQ
jgi:hypothetical protein